MFNFGEWCWVSDSCSMMINGYDGVQYDDPDHKFAAMFDPEKIEDWPEGWEYVDEWWEKLEDFDLDAIKEKSKNTD